jgi:hypothetical protein
MATYTEDHLIEQPAIQLMEHESGWESMNAQDELLGRGFGGQGGPQKIRWRS